MKDPVSYQIAAYIGGIIGTLIGAALVAGFYYLILAFVIKLPVTYLQVWGGVIIFECISNVIKNRMNQ